MLFQKTKYILFHESEPDNRHKGQSWIRWRPTRVTKMALEERGALKAK